MWKPWCPGRDSNPYNLAVTSPSSWRVYQFHHLGVAAGGVYFDSPPPHLQGRDLRVVLGAETTYYR